MNLVFVVEDDAALRRELCAILELEGLDWMIAQSYANAVEEIVEVNPDCVIMDVMLPGVDGRTLCRNLRAQSDVPIMMLTCLNSEFDEVTSLNLGADDYLTKPYRPGVMLAHLNALLRRRGTENRRTISHLGLTLDIGSGKAIYGEKTTSLTRNEACILALLMRNPDTVISRQEIMCELWESDAFIDDNTLTVNINRLRKALAAIDAPSDYIQTRRGQGYLV